MVILPGESALASELNSMHEPDVVSNLSYLGTLYYEHPETGRLDRHTSISKSSFSEVEVEQPFEGDKFGLPDFSKEALVSRLKKWNQPVRVPSDMFIEDFLRVLRLRKQQYPDIFVVKTPTFPEFMERVENSNLKHSSGLPGDYSSKREAIIDSNFGYYLYEFIRSGRVIPFLVNNSLLLKACLKDEVRALDESGQKSAARLFMADNLLSWATGLYLFGHSAEQLHNMHPYMIGFNPMQGGFQELFYEMVEKQQNLHLPDEYNSSDIGGCDSKYNAFLHYAMSGEFEVEPREIPLFNAFIHWVMTAPFVLDTGEVFARIFGMPSGVYITGFFTSLYCTALTDLLLLYTDRKLSEILAWPKLNYGDDCLMAWPKYLPDFFAMWHCLIESQTGHTLTNEHHRRKKCAPLLGSQILSMRFTEQFVHGFRKVVPYPERPNKAVVRIAYYKRKQDTVKLIEALLLRYWWKQELREFISARLREELSLDPRMTDANIKTKFAFITQRISDIYNVSCGGF